MGYLSDQICTDLFCMRHFSDFILLFYGKQRNNIFLYFIFIVIFIILNLYINFVTLSPTRFCNLSLFGLLPLCHLKIHWVSTLFASMEKITLDLQIHVMLIRTKLEYLCLFLCRQNNEMSKICNMLVDFREIVCKQALQPTVRTDQ